MAVKAFFKRSGIRRIKHLVLKQSQAPARVFSIPCPVEGFYTTIAAGRAQHGISFQHPKRILYTYVERYVPRVAWIRAGLVFVKYIWDDTCPILFRQSPTA